MLAALYTDSCAYSVIGGIASSMVRFGVGHPSFQALASRMPEGIPKAKIFASDRNALPVGLRNPLGIALDYRRWGLRGAKVVYSMYGEEMHFLKWAKQQEAKIAMDVFIHPGTNRIVAVEEERVLGVANRLSTRDEDAHSMRVFELADMLICPSSWVADGVRAYAPDCSEKIRIVPYGSSVVEPSASGFADKSEPGRILFAGRDPLRKGLHYLAEAAYLLRRRGLELNVRVAGVDANEIKWMPHAGEIECLGTVPMGQMKDEYTRASVFVLPSLSEGQAGVLLEAMACGCAVVATRESGVDIEPGSGILVPVCDAPALASALEEVLSSELKRMALASGALRQAALFSMDAWKGRLVGCVKELCDMA